MARKAVKKAPAKKTVKRAAPKRELQEVAPARSTRKRATRDDGEGPDIDSGGRYFAAPKNELKFIPTGCTLLDLAMGGGGWCRGRVANIVGDKSTGKTLLMIEACANFMRTCVRGMIHYWEAEAAFDKGYAAALGMPIKAIDFWDGPKEPQLDTVEDFFERLEKVIAIAKAKRVPQLVILDSLDALSDRAEMAREIDKGSFGASKAKQLSEMFRRVVRELERYDITLLIVSQVRDAIGVTFGDKHKRSGGKALDFYATHVIYLAHIARITKTIQNQKRAIGVEVKAQVKKNKVGLAFREAQFDIRFGYGTDDAQACVNWLKSVDRLPKTIPPRSRKDGKITNYLEEVIFKMDRDEERDHMNMVHDIVAQEWWAIENKAITRRGKYE